MITEEDFRQALHDHVAPLLADLRPEPGLVETLRRRQSRRTRMVVAGAGAAAVLVAVGATTVVQLVPAQRNGGSPPAAGPADAGPAPAPTVGDVPLVGAGDCAGLTVTATVQSAGWPTWRIAPGSRNNAITVPGGALMYLQASGPCVDALTFRTTGNLLQGADPTATANSFNPQGVGVVVSHTAAKTGTQTIELRLGCAKSARVCDGNPQELAVIDVTVVARAGSVPNVLMMSGSQAEHVLGAAGFEVARHVGSSTSAPVGVVVAQAPGSGLAAPGSIVTIVVSSGPPPSTCLPSALAIDYRGVTFGGGMDSAPMEIMNVSANPCTLVGPVTVAGLDASGHVVTNTQTFAVAPGLALTAHGPKLNSGETVPANVSVAWIPLSAQIHDAGGECADTVAPAAWRVSIGGVALLAPNGDGQLPASATQAGDAALGACRGQILDPGEQMISALS